MKYKYTEIIERRVIFKFMGIKISRDKRIAMWDNRGEIKGEYKIKTIKGCAYTQN